MTDKTDLSDRELELLFAQAAEETPLPSADFLARIVADADQAVQDFPNVAFVRRAPEQSLLNVFARIFDAIGGWPAVSGLAVATVAGVWIGYAGGDTVSGFADGYLTSETEYNLGDLMPSFDGLLGEG